MYKRSFIKSVVFVLSIFFAISIYANSDPPSEPNLNVSLKDVQIKKDESKVRIFIKTDSLVPFYVTMIENPLRLVVDLERVKAERGLKEKRFPVAPVERIRVGRHQSFTRLVFDLLEGHNYSEFSSSIEKGVIVINLISKNEEKAKIEPVVNLSHTKVSNSTNYKEVDESQQSQVKSSPDNIVLDNKKSVSEVKESKVDVIKDENKIKTGGVTNKLENKPDNTKTKNITLSGINIKQFNGYSRLSINFDNDNIIHEVLKETENEIQIGVYNCKVSDEVPSQISKVEKSGPVSMIQLLKSRKDSNLCVISVFLKEKAPYHLVRENKNINWDFYYTEKPQQIKFSEEMVAGEEKGEVLSEDTESKKTYKGKRISMDFKDANIHNILRLISEVAKINIVTSDDVKGNVTVTLRNVPWDQALEIILKTKGLGMKKVGNIIRVAPIEVFQKEAEAEMAKKKALEALEPLKVRLIPVNYGYARDIVAQVKDVLSDRGTINIDERTNVIIVKDKLENIIKAEGLVRSLDTQTPQVLIEARIVEANTAFIRDIGIQWGGNMVFAPQYGNPTGLSFPNIIGINGGADDARTLNQLNGVQNPAGFAVNMPAPVGAGAGGAIGFILGNASGSANLNLRLSALENTGHVKILSAPRVTTLDNKEAKISSGVSIPISQVSAAGVMTVFVDAKLELSVTPHVTQDGSIMLKIVTTKNEPDFSRTGAQGDPTILKKEAFTQVLVKDGDTTVIGGIYTRRQAEEYSKVPLLSNIPVLGWLFKKKKSSDERTELLIFITPRIVNRSEAIVQQKG